MNMKVGVPQEDGSLKLEPQASPIFNGAIVK